MNISFTFSKLIYNLFHDFRVEIIEETLNCSIVNHKGKYYGKYISYLATDNIDTTKINDLQNILKHHIELKYENYSYIIKVYHYELPSFIPFEYNPTSEICLGYSYDGKLKISFKDYTHLLICGTTGSGKTNLISSILLNLSCDKIYIDNKGGADNPLLDLFEVVTNVSQGIEKLYEISSLIEHRLSQLRQNKKTKLKRLVVVIDELYNYLLLPSKERNEIYALIGTMLSRSRVAKVNFILCCQRATSEIIPTLIKANIDILISMKTANAQESVNVIGCSDAFYIKDRGTGIVNLNGKIKTFKAMYVDDISNYVKKETVQNDRIEEENEIQKLVSENKDEVIYFEDDRARS